MTTIESYYLALCVSAFFVFGIALAYSTSSWKSWKETQKEPAEKPVAHARAETKLAA